jgi:pyridoxamine 5'-phosphate oxidase
VFDFQLDPFVNFDRQLSEAKLRGEPEYNAMALATAGADRQPSVRIVYYKGMVRGGFSFYTNYAGAKARDIDANPKVCLNFYYAKAWEQIRVEGVALKLTRAESEAYFATRARLSQIGAWASQQSEEIPSFESFQEKVEELEASFAGQAEIPCPPGWGGYHVVPQEIEFWFGKTGRLHERYVYQRESSSGSAGAGPGANGWRRFLRAP